MFKIYTIILVVLSSLLNAYEVRQIRRVSTKIPISKVPTVDLSEYGLEGSLMESRMDGSLENLTNIYYVMYVGDLYVGTPGQYMTVIYDTGSSNSLISSTKSGLNTSERYYESKNSSTYLGSSTKFSIQYGSGPMSGLLAQETFSFTDDIKISKHYFMEILVDGADIASLADGLIGLGRSGIAVGQLKPAFYQMIEQNQVDLPLFSVWMGDEKSGGELVFGGINPNRYEGVIDWMPCTDNGAVKNGYWSVNYNGMTIGTKYVASSSSTQTSAIIDTGTSDNYIFVTEFLAFVDANKRYLIQYESMFFIYNSDVKYLTPLKFHISTNRVYELSAVDIVRPSGVDGISLIAMFPTAGIVILGEPFLRKYYSIHDVGNNRIGLAKSAPPGYVAKIVTTTTTKKTWTRTLTDANVPKTTESQIVMETTKIQSLGERVSLGFIVKLTVALSMFILWQ